MRHSANILKNSPRTTRVLFVVASLLASLLFVAPALAGPREQARRMHDRLVGVPPASGVLDQMANLITAGRPLEAANLAMQNPLFYNSTLKSFVTPWTNEAQTVYAPLNDYTATVIGMIRDDVPFDRVLSADMIYIGAPGVVEAPYSHTDNAHYEALEASRADLSNPGVLMAASQSGLPGAVLPSSATAGVVTTRAAGEAYFSAGTNRRMFRFTSMNFMCRDLEDLKDTTRPTDRIRQDVTRSPGGDSTIFLNHCAGCHAGMDPLAGAYAYFQWDDEAERVVYTAGEVQPKNLINAGAFPLGYVTESDAWENYWLAGPNAGLGWSGPAAGNGPKSLGVEIASTRAFSVCQVEKVLAHLCLRGVGSQEDRDEVERIADVFESQNYSMKRVFAEVATYCMGD